MSEATPAETMELDEMLASLAALRSENAELEGELVKVEHERNEYRKLYELVHLELELERTRRHLFGKKGERVADEQLTLAFLKVAEAMKALEERDDEPVPNGQRQDRSKPKRPPTGRKPIPDHLPVERIELPAPPEVEADPEGFSRLGDDVSSTIEYRPGSYVNVEVVRPKFARKGEVEVPADGEVGEPRGGCLTRRWHRGPRRTPRGPASPPGRVPLHSTRRCCAPSALCAPLAPSAPPNT